jgi:hypothetical protein
LGQQEVVAFEYRIESGQMVTLYFEVETLRHLATEYQEPPELGQNTLRETFSDFQVIRGLDLPTLWTLTLEGPQETTEWHISFKALHLDTLPGMKYKGRERSRR